MRQWTIAAALVSLLGAMLLGGGCINVKVPDVDVDAPGVRVQTNGDRADRHGDDRYDEPVRDKVSKSEAYSIAKTVARRQGVRPEEYDIHDKEIGDVFWVIFERERPRGDEWQDHFTIRVAPDGAVEFYRTGVISKSHPYRRDEIDDDAAREIAKAIADREGADVRDYDIHDKGVRDNIWVFFEHKNGRAGWRDHFAVRVGKDARATFYAGN
jgi:hypothetical protein